MSRNASRMSLKQVGSQRSQGGQGGQRSQGGDLGNRGVPMTTRGVQSQQGLEPGSSSNVSETKNGWIDWDLMKSSGNKIGSGFLKYFPYILAIFVVFYLIYYVWSYYYDIRRQFNCYSLKNAFNGKFFKCSDEKPDYCKDIDPDQYWGWCLDPDYYGSYPGDRDGPYGFTCDRWITKPQHCPPIRCSGQFPIGIQVDTAPNPDGIVNIQEYGWCADPEINRALRGTYCGPLLEEGITCKNWIWNESKCPKTCPVGGLQSKDETSKSPNNEKSTQKQTQKQPQITEKKPPKCSIVCGLGNGPCPPPDCDAGGVQEQCKCVKI
jgi:hypothetical protein